MKEKREILVLTEERAGHFNKISAVMLGIFSAMGITAGVTGIFCVLGGIPAFAVPVFIGAAAAGAAALLDALTRKKAYGAMLCLLAAAVIFFLSVSGIIRGIYVWGNHFLYIWNQVFETFYEAFDIAGYTEADVQMAGTVLALSAAAAVWGAMRKRSFVLLTLLVYIPLCLSMALSVAVPVWTSAVLVAGWFGAWCRMSAPQRVRWETVLLSVGAGVILWLLPLTGQGVWWQRAAGEFRGRVSQGIEEIRFGEDHLPQGDLMRADRMLTGKKDCLRLEMETSMPLYLRGFTGSEYGENRWRHFPAETYGGEFSGMLSWLAGQDFYPGMQYGAYRQHSSEQEESGDELSVSVKNVGASRRYTYLPETVSVISEDAGKWKQDWSMEASGWRGKREYRFTCYDVQRNAEIQMPDSWIYQESDEEDRERFLLAERVYRSFVYDSYLDLDEEQRTLIETLFFQGNQGEAEGIYGVTSRIRTVLRILTRYQELPARVPEDCDFLSWFLTEGKEGNAAYFATAAVLAYRAAGIPARYVEGYVLTKEQAEHRTEKTVILSGKNAHAWVEIYVDGMGWRAVEVTPGFYEEFYQADVVLAVPNENFEGMSGDLAGVSVSEEYELPEAQETVPADSQEKSRYGHPLLLTGLVFLLLAMTFRLGRSMYLDYRYGKMSGEEKLYFLYGIIMKRMGKLYQEFNPQQPLNLPESEEYLFDVELYRRTVRRVERMIYGRQRPAPREIPAAEALARELQRAVAMQRKAHRPLWLSR